MCTACERIAQKEWEKAQKFTTSKKKTDKGDAMTNQIKCKECGKPITFVFTSDGFPIAQAHHHELDKAAEMNPGVEKVLSELKLRYFRGIANKCLKCGRTGNFGSISRVAVKKMKAEFIVCGWCGEITKIQSTFKGSE